MADRTMSEKLASIVVLYCDRNGQLWGIPYRLRDGQSPKNLQEPAFVPGDHLDQAARGRLNMKDWVWLGSPRWWGSTTQEDQKLVKAFLLDLDVPGGVFEWIYVEDARKP